MMETGYVFSSPWETINPLKRSSLWRNQYQYQSRPIVHEMEYMCLLTFGWTAESVPPMAKGVPNPPTPQLNIIIPPEWKCFWDTLFRRRCANTYMTGNERQESTSWYGLCFWYWDILSPNTEPYTETDWMEWEPGSHRRESVRTVSVQNLPSASRLIFKLAVIMLKSKIHFKPDLFQLRATSYIQSYTV